MRINNLPEDFTRFPYTVARPVDGVLWYWGSYRNHDRANEAARENGGITFETATVERGDF